MLDFFSYLFLDRVIIRFLTLLPFTNGIWFKEKYYALSLQGTLAVIEDMDSDVGIIALGKK